MCDPFINIHEYFETLRNGCIIAYTAVLYDITMLQKYLQSHNEEDIGVALATGKEPNWCHQVIESGMIQTV